MIRRHRRGAPELKIFVSHSARNDIYPALVREQVRKLLPPQDTLLVDMDRIRVGQDWCAVLYDSARQL